MNKNELKNYTIEDVFVEHFEDVTKLSKSKKAQLFGPEYRRRLSAYSYFKNYQTYRLLIQHHSVITTNVGYAELRNFPMVNALPQNCWMNWLNYHFCIEEPISSGNTLFLTFFLFDPAHFPNVLFKTLTEVFHRDRCVRFILVLQMPSNLPSYEDSADYSYLANISRRYYPRCFDINTCSNTQIIHVINRMSIVPLLRFRRALPEDNDDIVEIIDADRPHVREQLGDYYVAEELLSKKKYGCTLIIAEQEHFTVGFIWLNQHIDLLVLITNYELESFGNLMRFDSSKPYIQRIIDLNSSQSKSVHEMFTPRAGRMISSGYDHPSFSRRTLGIDLELYSTFSLSSATGTYSDRFVVRRSHFMKLYNIDTHLHNSSYYTYTVGSRSPLKINCNVNEMEQKLTDAEIAAIADRNTNAFAMQSLGIRKDSDRRKIRWFLLTGFSAFPKRDYCVFTVPKNVKMTVNLYENLRYFLRINPRPYSSMDDQLYLIHRSCVYGELSLHEPIASDYDKIRQLCQVRIKKASSIFATEVEYERFLASEINIINEIIDDIDENPKTMYELYTIRCGSSSRPTEENEFVGFLVLRPFVRAHEFRKHFNWPLIDESNLHRAEIVMLRLNPIFRAVSDGLMRETARVTGYFSFVYIAPNLPDVPPITNDLMELMEPVEPLHVKVASHFDYVYEPPEDERSSYLPSLQNMNYVDDLYSLFVHNIGRLEFVGSKTHLLIIGFTDWTKAFLRHLVFSFVEEGRPNDRLFAYIPGLMVTVSAEPGVVEAEYDKSFQCLLCKDQSKCWVNSRNSCAFLRDTVDRMDFRNWVNFVVGKVERIDREQKVVILRSRCKLYYDTLILATETMYGPPKPPLAEAPAKKPAKKLSVHNVPFDYPPNYMHINKRFDKITFYFKLKSIIEEMKIPNNMNIVVYGSSVDVYEFINFLITHGVHHTNIALVIPYDPNERSENQIYNNPYADENIENIAQEIVEDLNIKVYVQYNFVEWIRYTEDEYFFDQAKFRHCIRGDEITLFGDLFVSYNHVYIRSSTAKILKQADIKINANDQIEVDKRFATNDPNIYAIGGRSIAPNYCHNHQYRDVSPIEMAKKLVHILGLVNNVDPEMLDVKFNQPTYYQAQLPLQHFFVKVTLPKRYLRNNLTNDLSRSMYTYDGTFSRVRLNYAGVVEEIVVVTTEDICLDFLQLFCGKHEALLNGLHSRWCSGDIHSFLDFFREPWTQFITHPKLDKWEKTSREFVNEFIGDKINLRESRKQRQEKLIDLAKRTRADRKMIDIFLNFLRKYRSEFHHPFAMPEDFQDLQNV